MRKRKITEKQRFGTLAMEIDAVILLKVLGSRHICQGVIIFNLKLIPPL